MLPLYLLTNAKGQRMSIELKNGEIIEGELNNVDNWMNLTLINVTEHKTRDFGEISAGKQVEMIKLQEIYLKGIYIKYIRLQDDIIDNLRQKINSGNRDGNNKSFRNNKYNNNNNGSGNRGYGGNRRNYNNSNSGNNVKNSGNRRNYNNRRPYQGKPNSNNQQHGPPSSNGMGGYVHYENDAAPVEF
ncbi:U6 snRNA complex subunit LSM4 KNAG_0C03440 [Huiozyma naganishii CBS 8797]|uniref:LSM complex subunit LSM4 n=1 Tax=Huiozyma naganishii (strain ATCC MYA-139 / BCRC 22969 / CBS 8797 / KCTC 17520 / NBRC 10181 / NCYC 3082 / Yp74L-3) TaxID=1071383 RepID=J7S5Z9_HUIN7|nr:hypothetical protein KNAG_0C03440 [Kazachstania naganishii CBS 8797]CCK69451.1 hypothetical protein KNAG_0C03440 [Kazachstania naganishii CBS 8797]